jgi:hypothetical protein
LLLTFEEITPEFEREKKIAQSSACRYISPEGTREGMSLMSIRNRSCPRMEHCGILCLISINGNLVL